MVNAQFESSRWLTPGAILVLLLLSAFVTVAEGRTNNYCAYELFYSGKYITCGGHLQPGARLQ